MDDAEVARLWGTPSGVPRGVKLAIVVAAVGTIALVSLLLSVLHGSFPLQREAGNLDCAWLAGLGLAGAGAIALLAVSGLSDVSWWARGAVVLATMQLAIAIIAGVAWCARDDGDTWSTDVPSLAERMPAHWYAVALGGLVIVAAVVPGRRRGVPAWLRAAAVFALVDLVAVGCWLPLVGLRADREASSMIRGATLARAEVPFVLVPPALVAALVAAVVAIAAHRRRRIPPALSAAVLLALAGAVLVATVALHGGSARATAFYENYVHLLVGGAVFALCSLIALALAHLRALRTARRDVARPAPWTQQGRIVVDGPDPAPAQLVHHGWLGGFSTVAGAFALRTSDALLPIGAGAHVDAPIGGWTTAASAGDARALARAGDLVTVTGFVTPPDAGPFRSSGAPIAGDAGLLITLPRTADETIRHDLVLVLWRPCLLFLIAAVLCALPGLAADHGARGSGDYDPTLQFSTDP